MRHQFTLQTILMNLKVMGIRLISHCTVPGPASGGGGGCPGPLARTRRSTVRAPVWRWGGAEAYDGFAWEQTN